MTIDHDLVLDTRQFLVLLPLLIGCGSSVEDPDNSIPAAATDDGKPGNATNPGEVVPDDGAAEFRFTDHNLVFVSFDALQAAHVGCYGGERDVTPTIDMLAERGIRFENHTSVASWTVPSSMTWFTGAYPSEHRMVNKYAVYDPPNTRLADLRDLAPNLVTLADVLKENGYATGGFTGNAGVSGGFGYEQGFDEYFYEPGRFGRFEASVPRALAWAREHADEKFFLFLHGYDVHGQSLPSGGLDLRFVDPEYDGRYTGAEIEQEILREEGLDKGHVDLRDEDVRFWRAVYDEKIQRADERFRVFVRQFEQLGLMDRTIFVLTSDHGTEFHEHGRFDHGFTLYQELIHVPLVVVLPNGVQAEVPGRTSSIDLMPTILDLLDVDVSEPVGGQLRGRSLVPAMQGRHEVRDVFAETDYREYTYKRAIISPEGWKFVYTLEDEGRELYDLTADAAELRNLAEDDPDRADALQRRLFDQFDAIGHDLRARDWKTGLNPVYPSQGQ